ncbi:MAG: FAD:protein FMN transferase [Planctomycetaceae bacterium]|nr:FAD:protein FMN transferase [Planctomycetales bacterium]MCB9923292.1 FAD:protein FMN transferase [Planctomycetaceae bacterium]
MAAKPQSNRRQFLTGQAALDAVAGIGDKGDASVDQSRAVAGRAETETYLIQVERTAMACDFQILLNAGEHSGATEIALDAMDEIERLEEQLSWFRETSELSRINREAASAPVVVESGLFDLLAEALTISQQTGGAFDITASPLWKLWGFHRREGKVPDESEIVEALSRTGAHQIELNHKTQSIFFAREGVEINLGAIGKGYALDRCAKRLAAGGVENFLIHGGQSSMLARGRRAGISEANPGWTIALRHPLKPDQRLAEIHLRNRALGTSGSGNQYFHAGGRRYGHVLDARTGRPAETLLSATVLAPTASQADALATAFFVMGIDECVAFCEARPELGALLVAPGERAGTMEVLTVGIAEDEWRRIE